MDILEAISGAQGGGAVQQLGQQFGLSNDQVSSASSALVPALAAGCLQAADYWEYWALNNA